MTDDRMSIKCKHCGDKIGVAIIDKIHDSTWVPITCGMFSEIFEEFLIKHCDSNVDKQTHFEIEFESDG